MSAFLTHLAVGALLGLALRLPLRYVPIAALIAELPDLDHLDMYGVPFVESRVTFHNVWFAIALPLAIFAILYWRRANPDWLRLAAAAPLLLTGHLLLDMLPFEAFGGVSKLPLFWPVSDVWFTLPLVAVQRIDPREFSTMTIVLVTLITLTVLTVLALPHVTQRRESPRRVVRHAAPAAFIVVWLLLVPGLAAAGLFTAPPGYANAALVLEDGAVELSAERYTGLVRHLGGAGAWRGHLTVDVTADGQVVASAKNPETLQFGQAWPVVIALPPETAEATVFKIVLRATNGNVTYAETTPQVDRSHLPLDLGIVGLQHDARNRGLLTLVNDARAPVPPGAVLVALTLSDGSKLELQTSRRLQQGDEETLTFSLPGTTALNDVRIVLRSPVDGHVYLEESRRPTLRGPLDPLVNTSPLLVNL